MCAACLKKKAYIRIHDNIQTDPDLATNTGKQSEIVKMAFKGPKPFKLVSRVELRINDYQTKCCAHEMQSDWLCCPYCGQNIVREFLFIVEDDIPRLKEAYKKKKGYEMPSYEQRNLKAAFYLEIDV